MHNEFFLFINDVLKCPCFLEHNNLVLTSLPYFGVKLSCVCLMFAYRKK